MGVGGGVRGMIQRELRRYFTPPNFKLTCFSLISSQNYTLSFTLQLLKRNIHNKNSIGLLLFDVVFNVHNYR